MAVSSRVVEEIPGKGRGHFDHGNGKGKGHQKHAEDAMADGVYKIGISGIDHDNPTSTSQTSNLSKLADGTGLNTEVRQGSISIVDPAGTGDDGDGALHLVTDNGNGRLRVNDVFDADNRFTLGELDSLSFDYMVEASDRTDVIPVFRLMVDADGDLSTTNDRGELVFEWAYQGLGAVTQDTWQTADLAGDDWVVWQRSVNQNFDQIANMANLSDWTDADGHAPAGGIHFDQNSVVLGWSIALGSGNGTTSAYVDNLQVGGVTYDFMV